jgi:hypothetical protein
VATGIPIDRSAQRTEPWRRIALPWWTAQAWGAIGITTLFLAITCWWLTQDRSIPIYDAGLHLSLAFAAYRDLSDGRILDALTLSIPYPPFAYLIGDLGIAFGGIDVAPPIIAENFVFVPLLALGCYHVGRLAFDRTAGLLAVAFALSSPLITAQFHVFMIDAPETAMVAVSVWAILATEGFRRVRLSALAGLAVGIGLLTKEPFIFFVAGPVAVSALRAGMEAWRGLLLFTLVALAIALPWYAHELSQVSSVGLGAVNAAGSSYRYDISPARFSLDNFTWYFWNILNAQLYLPMFAFSALGWLWAVAGLVRRRHISRLAPELTIGALVAWLAITETFTHDTRYSMPLLVYLSVFGVGWITRLRSSARRIVTTVLVLVCVANVAGASLGVGREVHLTLPGANAADRQQPGVVRIFSDVGFLVGAPRLDGNILETLRALRRNGISGIALEPSSLFEPDFSAAGVTALAEVAHLGIVTAPEQDLTLHDAVLHHAPIEPGEIVPCVRLADGTGVWMRLGDPNVRGVRNYCPSHHPQFYGPGYK